MTTPHDSYWLRPGRLLAGPYPGAKYGVEAEAKLEDFLDLGVTSFVDLTEEDEGLEPYADLSLELAAQRGIDVQYRRMPIRDVDVPSVPEMRAILDHIEHRLGRGRLVYVHCWGGVGRTGTVMCCHLIETTGVDGAEAISRLRHLRRHTMRAHRLSPETLSQEAFVEAWAERHLPGARARA